MHATATKVHSTATTATLKKHFKSLKAKWSLAEQYPI